MYAGALTGTVAAHSRARQAGVLLAVVAMLLFGGTGVLVRDGRPPDPAAPDRAATGARSQPSFDVDAVVDQIRHTIAPVRGGAGTLEVANGGYRATFGPSGFTFRPAGSSGALAVRTESLSRGEQPLGLDVGRWTASGSVATRALAPDVREQVTARSGEVEWDVVLAAEPAGSGDLVVDADLDGIVAQTEVVNGGRQLQLTLVGGATVEMGETVVLDANGRVLHRSLPTVGGGSVELVVPGAVLEGAAYPLVVDPTVTGTKQVTSALGRQPSVAFDGEDYLVAWSEYDGSNFEIVAAQVNGDGTLVQPIGTLSTGGDGKDEQRPAVSWNGSRFLVVWEHTFSGTDIDVYGRVVNRAGFPVTGVIPIVTPTGNQTGPAVAAQGATFHLVWSDANFGSGDIRGMRINSAGTSLDSYPGTALAIGSNAETSPDIAASSSGLLVTYELLFSPSDLDVYAQRADLSLQPTGAAIPIATSGVHEEDPKVASSGSAYLVVWARSGDIQGRRLGTNGSLLDGAPIPVSDEPDNQSLPDVTFDGTYLVAWKDNRNFWNDIWAARVDTGGAVLDPTGFVVLDQASNSGTAAIDAPPSLAPGPGSNRWAIDHEMIFGGIFHHTVTK